MALVAACAPSLASHPVVWCPNDDATSPTFRDDPHGWPTATGAAIAALFATLP